MVRSPVQALFKYDKNLNNKFDRRITRSLQTDGGLLWVEEVDPLENEHHQAVRADVAGVGRQLQHEGA